MKNINIDYVTKDFDGFFEMMKENIPILTPEWTDTTDSDQGIVILQLLAYGLHVLGYYQDRAVNENILQYARTRKGILTGCNFLGYSPARQTPATVTVKFTKDTSKLNEDVIIPAGTKISTDPKLGDEVIFETDEELTILAGDETGTVSATQCITIKNELLGYGNGLPGQKFTLKYPDVLLNTITVTTTENLAKYSWHLRENFIDSTFNSRHFIEELNEENKSLLTFGNGTLGMKIPDKAKVTSTYKYGGGTRGNVAVGKINYLYDDTVAGISSVINEIAATGGTDYEDLNVSKILAPKAYRSGGKCVNWRDFEDVAEGIVGVSKAKCVETYNISNDVYLYIATDNFSSAGQNLKDTVRETIENNMVMNQNLFVFDADYSTYTLDIDILTYSNFVNSDVQANVESYLSAELIPSNYEFGETLYLSDIARKCFSVKGVRNVIINTPVDDVSCTNTQLPKAESITVNVSGGV